MIHMNPVRGSCASSGLPDLWFFIQCWPKNTSTAFVTQRGTINYRKIGRTQKMCVVTYYTYLALWLGYMLHDWAMDVQFSTGENIFLPSTAPRPTSSPIFPTGKRVNAAATQSWPSWALISLHRRNWDCAELYHHSSKVSMTCYLITNTSNFLFI